MLYNSSIMFGSIRIGILTVGVCAIGLALLFETQKSLLETFFSLSMSPPLVQKHTPPETAFPHETIDNTTPETETKEIEEKTEHVLGMSPEKLKTAQEERLLVEETTATPPTPLLRLPSQTLYALASERVVNLFCELPNNEVAIATGVIIHPQGYILTNAHVAQTEQSHTCLIRRGSPARNFAIAERVFLPPNFSSQSHTRENLAQDVAIWKITNVIERSAIGTFPFFSIRPHA